MDINPPPGTFDPYRSMIQRKRAMDTGDLDPGTIIRWPKEDTKALKDYCDKLGIYGFSTKLHPKIVIAQLKKQFGEDFTGVPLDERVPTEGYEKLGTKPNYNPSYPYSEDMRRKQILHG